MSLGCSGGSGSLWASQPWSPGFCRWRPENTCLCTRRLIPRRLTYAIEREELRTDAFGEHKELAAIYVARGLDASLAKEVAEQLMAHDALGSHARDELRISTALTARPIQAASSSATSFAVGSALPLVAAILAPQAFLIPIVAIGSLVFLAALGAWAAAAGGASGIKGAIRVTFWGALAMAVTAAAGALFGATP